MNFPCPWTGEVELMSLATCIVEQWGRGASPVVERSVPLVEVRLRATHHHYDDFVYVTTNSCNYTACDVRSPAPRRRISANRISNSSTRTSTGDLGPACVLTARRSVGS